MFFRSQSHLVFFFSPMALYMAYIKENMLWLVRLFVSPQPDMFKDILS